jgi:hypothetical protein
MFGMFGIFGISLYICITFVTHWSGRVGSTGRRCLDLSMFENNPVDIGEIAEGAFVH